MHDVLFYIMTHFLFYFFSISIRHLKLFVSPIRTELFISTVKPKLFYGLLINRNFFPHAKTFLHRAFYIRRRVCLNITQELSPKLGGFDAVSARECKPQSYRYALPLKVSLCNYSPKNADVEHI